MYPNSDLPIQQYDGSVSYRKYGQPWPHCYTGAHISAGSIQAASFSKPQPSKYLFKSLPERYHDYQGWRSRSENKSTCALSKQTLLVQGPIIQLGPKYRSRWRRRASFRARLWRHRPVYKIFQCYMGSQIRLEGRHSMSLTRTFEAIRETTNKEEEAVRTTFVHGFEDTRVVDNR